MEEPDVEELGIEAGRGAPVNEAAAKAATRTRAAHRSGANVIRDLAEKTSSGTYRARAPSV
jgi:hypothetical protein